MKRTVEFEISDSTARQQDYVDMFFKQKKGKWHNQRESISQNKEFMLNKSQTIESISSNKYGRIAV